MTSRKLPHYLRASRKQLGLSQDEMAWLLGCENGTKVSRYERFAREPRLSTAFGYAIVCRTSGRKLFAGLFEEVEGRIASRARLLRDRLKARKDVRRLDAKLAILDALGDVSYRSR